MLAPLAPAATAACLAELRASLAAVADDWVAASVASKGWREVPHAAAEEWASGPLAVARYLARLALPPQPLADLGPFADGCRRVAPPRLAGDGLLLFGHHATLHLDPTPPPTAAAGPAGGVCLVLGAGNVTATPVLDALEQVFVHRRAVQLKLSPLHRDLAPVLARALAPLLRGNALALAAGDARDGRALARRADVTAIHLTGSAATWHQLAHDPELATRHCTAEVGCSTPVLVLPGAWSARELAATAHQLAAYTAYNGGGTCAAPRVLLTAADWPQRRELLAALHAAFAALPPRVPFHPQARDHWQRATGRLAPDGALPPLLVADQTIDSARAGAGDELFAPVLREFPLAGADFAAFARATLAFVHAQCFGHLSAYVFAPGALLRRERARVHELVAALPHGTVAINTWTGLAYGLGTTPWGVPAASPRAYGVGFARGPRDATVRRVVVETRLPAAVMPPWLPQHRRGAAAMRALTQATLDPSLWRLLRTALHALRP